MLSFGIAIYGAKLQSFFLFKGIITETNEIITPPQGPSLKIEGWAPQVPPSEGVEKSGTSSVIVITFYSPSCLGLETAKGPFGLRVKLPPAQLSTTHGGGFTLSH